METYRHMDSRIILFFLLLSFNSFGQRFFLFGKSANTAAAYFSNVSTNQSGNEISVTFDYERVSDNQPPSFERVYVTGTPEKGQTLTCNTEGFYSPGGYSQGTTTYAWYSADNAQSTGTVISGATSSTFVPMDDEVAKRCRCTATAVESGSMNTGTAVTSTYTDAIDDTEFNPYTDLAWFTAHRHDGYSAGTWVNLGTGNNSTQNGSDNVPTAVADGADFESGNNEELVLDQPTPQFSMPVEVWVRVKFESFNGAWAYIIDWNGAQRLEQRTSGAIYLSNASCSFTPTVGNWVVMRFVISGTSNTSKFNANNGTELTNIAAVTTAFGTSNGRIGSNATGTGNRFDGLISHIFIKQGELSGGDVTNMWTWFSTNADWD